MARGAARCKPLGGRFRASVPACLTYPWRTGNRWTPAARARKRPDFQRRPSDAEGDIPTVEGYRIGAAAVFCAASGRPGHRRPAAAAGPGRVACAVGGHPRRADGPARPALAADRAPVRRFDAFHAAVPLHHDRHLLQPDAALQRRRRRHAHLATRQAARLAGRELFGVARPADRTCHAGVRGRRLPAVDLRPGAGSDRPHRPPGDRSRQPRRLAGLPCPGLGTLALPAALVADAACRRHRDRRRRHPAHPPCPGVGRADLGHEPHADGAVRLVRRARQSTPTCRSPTPYSSCCRSP